MKETYTKIPNEIMQVLMTTRLRMYEFRVIMVVARKAYGWNKESDWIANSQFAEMTNIQPSHACNTVRNLTRRKILVIIKGNEIAINPITTEWRELPQDVTSHNKSELLQDVTKVASTSNEIVTPGGTTKNIYKEKRNPPIVPREDISFSDNSDKEPENCPICDSINLMDGHCEFCEHPLKHVEPNIESFKEKWEEIIDRYAKYKPASAPSLKRCPPILYADGILILEKAEENFHAKHIQLNKVNINKYLSGLCGTDIRIQYPQPEVEVNPLNIEQELNQELSFDLTTNHIEQEIA